MINLLVSKLLNKVKMHMAMLKCSQLIVGYGEGCQLYLGKYSWYHVPNRHLLHFYLPALYVYASMEFATAIRFRIIRNGGELNVLTTNLSPNLQIVNCFESFPNLHKLTILLNCTWCEFSKLSSAPKT